MLKMDQKVSGISEFRDRITEYYKNIGEHMKNTNNRLNKMEANQETLLNEISIIKETADTDRKKSLDAISTIKETADTDRQEFLDTISVLVENLKEIVQFTEPLPPLLEPEKNIENPLQVEVPKQRKR